MTIMASMRPPEEKKKDSRKKPWKKPQIKSGRFYERKALACAKVEGGPGECGSGFFS